MKKNIFKIEEITLLDETLQNIYAENRIRLIIHKNTNLIDVFFTSYQKQSGLCYNYMELFSKEYDNFKSINDLVQKILIEGEYSDYCIGIATGIYSKDADKFLEEKNEYSIDI